MYTKSIRHVSKQMDFRLGTRILNGSGTVSPSSTRNTKVHDTTQMIGLSDLPV